MRLRPTRFFCLLSAAPQGRRLLGKLVILGLVLPHLAAATPLEPIMLRKNWLEPIVLKKPVTMTSQAAEEPATSPEATAPSPPSFANDAATLPAVDTAPLEAEPLEEASIAVDIPPAPEPEAENDPPPAPLPPADQVTTGPLQSLRTPGYTQAAALSTPVNYEGDVLPMYLARLPVPEGHIETADAILNKLIDIADHYADTPQLLLEIRGLAPMTATDSQRRAAYQNAQLMMSGLISAGIPYHRLSAFVMLLDDAPGSVDIIRLR